MKNPIAEHVLDQHGVEYSYVTELWLNQINKPVSQTNKARLTTPRIQERVDQYARKFEGGGVPPAIIVRMLENGQYGVMDGNHRVYAAEKVGIKTLDAYVVHETNTDILHQLTVTLNQDLGGIGSNMDDLYANAVDAVLGGMSFKDAAIAYGYLNEARLYDHHRARVMADLLKRLGHDIGVVHTARQRRGQPIFSMSMLKFLHPLRNDHPVLQEMARVVRRTEAPADQIGVLVTDLGKETDEVGRLRAIAEYEARPEVQARLPKARQPKRRPMRRRGQERFFDLMRSIARVLGETKKAEDIHVQDAALEAEAHRLAKDVNKHLVRLFS